MRIVPALLVVFFLLITGCEVINQKDYQLMDIAKEKSDLDHAKQNDNLRVFFSVSNGAELTLNSKVEVKLNIKCFSKTPDKELGEIPPQQSSRSFVTIILESRVPDECVKKPHDIALILKDVNGKILDSKNISIGII